MLLLLLLFGAINYQNALIYGVAFLLGSLFLVTILHTYKNLAGLTLEFVQSRPGFVGENIEFQIKISQPSGTQHEGIQLGWPTGVKQWVQLRTSGLRHCTFIRAGKSTRMDNPWSTASGNILPPWTAARVDLDRL